MIARFRRSLRTDVAGSSVVRGTPEAYPLSGKSWFTGRSLPAVPAP